MSYQCYLQFVYFLDWWQQKLWILLCVPCEIQKISENKQPNNKQDKLTFLIHMDGILIQWREQEWQFPLNDDEIAPYLTLNIIWCHIHCTFVIKQSIQKISGLIKSVSKWPTDVEFEINGQNDYESTLRGLITNFNSSLQLAFHQMVHTKQEVIYMAHLGGDAYTSTLGL